MDERTAPARPSDTGGGLGPALRRYRVRARLSQEQLAERARLTAKTVSNIERGQVHRPQARSIRLLVDALGLDPAERAAFEAAARDAEWLGIGPPPFTLPADLADFVGREGMVAAVEEAVLGGTAGPGLVPVCVLAGMAGAGKSALAIHVAHRLASAFPDGQLFVPMHGMQQRQLEPAVALVHLLTLLGEDARRLPPGLDALTAMARSRLADRRVLLVLDDVADEAHVRPFIPAGPRCAVLVTSRPPLVGLESVRRVDVDLFTEQEALTLLESAIGAARLREQRADAATVVELCGRLPLAVRIVGARLAARTDWPLRRLAVLLSDERQRLAELTAGDLRVDASIQLSYRALSADERRAVRLLGLLDAPDFAVWVAAAVLECSPARALAVVERLVDARLLATRTDQLGEPRYQFHQLVRAYARHRGQVEEDATTRQDAIVRAVKGWLELARCVAANFPSASLGIDAAGPPQRRVVSQPPASVTRDPLGWLDAELPALAAAVAQSAASGSVALAGDLTWSLTGYFSLRRLLDEWAAAAEAVLAAARRAGDRRNEAAALLALAELDIERNRPEPARRALEAALDLAGQYGHLRLQARATVDLGILHRARGDVAGARRAYERALPLLDRCGDHLGAAWALSDLAVVCQADGEQELALAHLETALTRMRAGHDARGEAKTLLRLGVLLGRRHEPEAAEAAEARLTEALSLSRHLQDRRGQNEALYRLGVLAHDRGDLRAADRLLSQALADSREVADDQGEAYVSDRLGRVCTELGDADRARASLLTALAFYQRTDDRARERSVRDRLEASA